MGSQRAHVFYLVDCFELFLKENPSSQAVNICCGISGLTQELCESVPVRLFASASRLHTERERQKEVCIYLKAVIRREQTALT